MSDELCRLPRALEGQRRFLASIHCYTLRQAFPQTAIDKPWQTSLGGFLIKHVYSGLMPRILPPVLNQRDASLAL